MNKIQTKQEIWEIMSQSWCNKKKVITSYTKIQGCWTGTTISKEFGQLKNHPDHCVPLRTLRFFSYQRVLCCHAIGQC